MIVLGKEVFANKTRCG